MTGATTLRQAHVEDASEIARLAGELGYSTPVEIMGERLKSLINHPDHCIKVVQDGDALCGWIAAEHRRTLESGERIEIVGLVVDARYRGAGVGSTLVKDVEQWARQQGFSSISVRSNITRDASHPFYERLGYIRHKTQHSYTKALDA